ncbi:hypothetical protein ACS0TY_032692 [Phlomoides rotata]
MGGWVNGEWVWNFRWTRTLSARDLTSFNEIISFLNKNKLHQRQVDHWEWIHCNKGKYVVNKAYKVLLSRREGIEQNIRERMRFSKLWKSWAVRKATTTAWKILKDRMTTTDNLGGRGISLSSDELKCQLCKEQDESIGHLFFNWQLTKKADVCSLGVLILEIISGRNSSKAAFGEDFHVLLEWTWKLYNEGRLLDIVDPDLIDYPKDEITRFMKVALFCTQAASQQRPDMKQVVKMLSSDVILNKKLPTEPGLYRPHSSRKSKGGSLPISSHSDKGKQSAIVSNQLDDAQTITDMIPR